MRVLKERECIVKFRARAPGLCISPLVAIRMHADTNRVFFHENRCRKCRRSREQSDTACNVAQGFAASDRSHESNPLSSASHGDRYGFVSIALASPSPTIFSSFASQRTERPSRAEMLAR